MGVSHPAQFESPADALRAAVECVGSQSAMARLLGLKQASVWAWLDKRKVLPAEHVLAVEAETGISRHDLRPDIYPLDPPAAARAGTDLESAR